jgi:hypothetical protein
MLHRMDMEDQTEENGGYFLAAWRVFSGAVEHLFQVSGILFFHARARTLI